MSISPKLRLAKGIPPDARGRDDDYEAMAAAADSEGMETPAPSFAPVNFATLAASRPERAPEIIHGIARRGFVTSLVSQTKARKSWLVGQLMMAVADSMPRFWLGHRVSNGRVLLIDGELTLATINFRLGRIAEALQVPAAAWANIDICPLRGRTKDAPKALAWAMAQPPETYSLIVVDPLYCFYPSQPGFSENDNAAMRTVFDQMIAFAGKTAAAVVVIHHSSKGSQAEKHVSDVGAGAGSIMRSVDAHLVLRAHREKDAVVFDGIVRDFPELTPTCWRWRFPQFEEAPELDPTDLAGTKQKKSKTAEFLEGGSKTPELDAKGFSAKFITDEPKQAAAIEAMAEAESISSRRCGQLLKQAVALGLAYRWGGSKGVPAMICSKPPTLQDMACDDIHSRARTPPTPPIGAKTPYGAGVTGARKRKRKAPRPETHRGPETTADVEGVADGE